MAPAGRLGDLLDPLEYAAGHARRYTVSFV
jgi:hypothetical protein